MKKSPHVVANPRGNQSQTLKVALAFLERFEERHAAFVTTVCEYRQKRQQLKETLK